MNVIEDFLIAFFEQPPRIMIVMGLVLFGWILKKSDSIIDAKWIPVILPVLGIIAFPVALGIESAEYGRLGVEGFVGGCLAVWINQVYRQLFASKSVGSGVLSGILRGMSEKEEQNEQNQETKGDNAKPVPDRQPGGDGNIDANSGMY